MFAEARAVLAEGVDIVDPELRIRGRWSAPTRVRCSASASWRSRRNRPPSPPRSPTPNDDLWTEAVAHWVLGGIRTAQGRLDEARTLASRAVSGAERISDTNLLMRFSLDLAAICAEMDDHVGQAVALRRVHTASRKVTETLQEGLGQALEQRRLAVTSQRLAIAAQQAAARDPLTGLVNRLGLERQAPQLLENTAARGRVPWLCCGRGLVQGVNDNAGHAAGDAALREIAQLLRKETRSDDLVSAGPATSSWCYWPVRTRALTDGTPVRGRRTYPPPWTATTGTWCSARPGSRPSASAWPPVRRSWTSCSPPPIWPCTGRNARAAIAWKYIPPPRPPILADMPAVQTGPQQARDVQPH